MHSGREKAPKPHKRLNCQNMLSLTTRKNFLDAVLSDPNKGSTLAKSPVIPFLLGAYFPLWITPFPTPTPFPFSRFYPLWVCERILYFTAYSHLHAVLNKIFSEEYAVLHGSNKGKEMRCCAARNDRNLLFPVCASCLNVLSSYCAPACYWNFSVQPYITSLTICITYCIIQLLNMLFTASQALSHHELKSIYSHVSH